MPEALEWLRDIVGVGPGLKVLELGAGTGKFMPLLRQCGATFMAVEPIDAMRAQLTADFPEAQALAGSAEAIPLPDASVDAVVCAEAFHWFANVAALQEIRRVLAPGAMCFPHRGSTSSMSAMPATRMSERQNRSLSNGH